MVLGTSYLGQNYLGRLRLVMGQVALVGVGIRTAPGGRGQMRDAKVQTALGSQG